MKYPVYTIRDKIKGFVPQMFLELNEQSAVRGFGYQVNNDQYMKYSPADYDLFRVGIFDTESGKISESDMPEFIVNGGSLFSEK